MAAGSRNDADRVHMPIPSHSPAPEPHTMRCMEVWGGNHRVDSGVVMPGLDVWVFSVPFHDEAMGGDVHYVSSCGTGRICRLVVADVSGHGERVSTLARSLRTLMRRFVNYLDQSRFIEALNRGFLAGDDSGRFATTLAMTFFAPNRRLDICNAGHPRPMLRRARTGRWEMLVAPDDARTTSALMNLPLGVLEPTAYEDFGLELARGDLLLVYTDAVTEARAATGELLGEEGLLRLLQEVDPGQPELIIPSIVARLDAWRDGVEPDDDITLLLLRANGIGSQAKFLSRLMGSIRFLGILGRALIPLGERPPIPWPEVSIPNLLGAFSAKISNRWSGPQSE